MTDKAVDDPRSPGDRDAGTTAEPVIPDGGLGEAMPDWLRRPPAWRGLAVPPLPTTDAESAPSGQTADAGSDPAPDNSSSASSADAPTSLPEAAQRTARVLPAPDDSPIDPSSLIELTDLPAWLVGIGKREIEGSTASQTAVHGEYTSTSADTRVADASEAAAVPLPPFLRDRDGEDASMPEATSQAPAAPGTGIPRHYLTLAGVLIVLIAIAILLAIYG
ncbi:MAG: hypothetical protein WBA46_14565 [Thermomicrobiales bacterium]